MAICVDGGGWWTLLFPNLGRKCGELCGFSSDLSNLWIGLCFLCALRSHFWAKICCFSLGFVWIDGVSFLASLIGEFVGMVSCSRELSFFFVGSREAGVGWVDDECEMGIFFEASLLFLFF